MSNDETPATRAIDKFVKRTLREAKKAEEDNDSLGLLVLVRECCEELRRLRNKLATTTGDLT